MQRHQQTLPNPSLRRAIMPLAVALLLVSAVSTNTTQAQASPSSEPRNEAAILAANEGWNKAEASGDIAYLDALLLPEYRSISSDGSTHDKAAILAGARKTASSPERAAAREVAAAKWRETHAHLSSVQITGDTAIRTSTMDGPDATKRVMSCDIYVYREGHWRALYSQHTEAGK